LKIVIEGKTYYVHVQDIGRALADANFKAYILKLSEPSELAPKFETKKSAEVVS
jgi:hypothetical protein